VRERQESQAVLRGQQMKPYEKNRPEYSSCCESCPGDTWAAIKGVLILWAIYVGVPAALLYGSYCIFQ
jgi:hypothetical protein